MKRWCWRGPCALSLLLACARADAGPPFLTDDPVPVDVGHGEINLFQMLERWRHEANGTAAGFEANYGIHGNTQLHLIIPLAYEAPAAGHGHAGLGDIETGVKYRFVQESSRMPQIAAFPTLELPTASRSRGLGDGHAQVFLPLWAQKSRGAWTIDAGGGYWINPGTGNRNYLFGGACLQCQVQRTWLVGAELYHTTASSPGASGGSGCTLGAVHDLDQHLHLLASLGRTISGAPLITSYAALQITW